MIVIDASVVFQFYDDFADEIWMPGFIYNKRQDQIRAEIGSLPIDSHTDLAQYTTDYVVIGPITSDLQRATGVTLVIIH